MSQFYKSKKAFMPLGMLAIALAVGVSGSLVSFLYLKINQICPSIYLCILCAFGFGALMGGIAYFFISVMKIRSKASAIVGIILGCIIFTIFKWALYVQWDYEKYYYEPLQDEKAFSYFEFEYDFLNDDGSLMSDEDIEEMVEAMQHITADYYMELTYEGGTDQYIIDMKKDSGKTFTKSELEGMSSFDFFYDGYVDEDDIVGSIKAAYKMDAYEYYYEYLKAEDIKDVKFLIAHPKDFIDSIKDINEYGRWSISNSSSSYSSINGASTTKNDNVKGVMLWIVWLGELLLICIPAVVIAANRADKPFIESEKAWAKLNDSDGLMFRAPAIPNSAAVAVKANPDAIFTYEHLPVRPGNAGFLKAEIYHSRNYDENYLNLVLRSYNPKNRNYNSSVLVKYLAVDKTFVYKLFKHCVQDVPFAYSAYEETLGKMEPAQPAIPSADYLGEIPKTDAAAPTVSELERNEKTQEEIFEEMNK